METLGCEDEDVRTWRQTLLELLGLIRVLEHERVDEARGPDLELDVVGLGVLLYAGGCSIKVLANFSWAFWTSL